VQGNATLVVTSSINIGSKDGITLAPGSSLTIYMEGKSTSIKGNGFANPGSSTNLVYYGLPNNTDIDMSGNAAFNGIIYAPEADVKLGGGGNNAQDLGGSLTINTLTLNGHFNFHYDFNTRKVTQKGYKPSNWAEQ
jgi:choice-of-anchor A domain-containing protein